MRLQRTDSTELGKDHTTPRNPGQIKVSVKPRAPHISFAGRAVESNPTSVNGTCREGSVHTVRTGRDGAARDL